MPEPSQNRGRQTRKDVQTKPLKVCCAYCKHLFVVEGKIRTCPTCGKVAVMPGQLDPNKSEKRRKFLRRSMLAHSGAGSTMAMAFHEVLSARRFTRIMLVVGAVGIIGAVVFDVPAPVPYVPPTSRQTAQRELTVLRVALERFERDSRRYPTTEEGLKALVQRPPGLTGWDGYYVTLVRPDPWGYPYVYRLEDGRITLLSLGADGAENTADDIPVPPISSEQLAPYLEKNNQGWVTPDPTMSSAGKKQKNF